MNNVDERFDEIKSNVKIFTNMLDNMSIYGVFGSYEFKSCIVITQAMIRAMTILNPEETKAFLESVLTDSSRLTSMFQESQGTDNIGQYL